MQITKLKLVNFRNFSDLSIEFVPTKNIIIGNNGMGKTNLIEAIYTLALTKSFRGTTDDILIKKDEEIAYIEGTVFNTDTRKYKVTVSKEGKKVKINNKKQDKISEYISNINTILFNPDDLKIIKSNPSIRRKFLNIEISQLDNLYLKNVNDYNKVLKQRNSYLKTMFINNFTSKEYLDILTDKLITLGEKIYKARKQFISEINKRVEKIYYEITKEKELTISYNSDYNDISISELSNKYDRYFNKDMTIGQTQLGIHRDDFTISLNNDNLKDYGSEGQQKTAILAVKLAELDIFYIKKKTYPILILDDLFSEIDSEKINKVINLLKNDVQTFITATDLNKINKEILKDSKIYKITEGKVEET